MQRTLAYDWMRGLVMIVMTLDHASLFFNAARFHGDSVATFVPHEAIDPAQFFTRWITHLCAPTFVFLAGLVLALSERKRRLAGETPHSIDRDMLIRGAFIVFLDVFYISLLAGHHILQVLWVLGGSMLCLVPLRRLPVRYLLVLAITILAFSEAATFALWSPDDASPNVVLAALLTRHVSERAWVFYPLLPWLAVALLGWCYGHVRATPAKTFLAGLGALALFVLVRAANAYGNMRLYRADAGLLDLGGAAIQWLNVCKYPPSVSFFALELGLSLLCIALFMAIEARIASARDWNPLLVFGQSALFFYVIHQVILLLIGKTLGFDNGGLVETYALSAIALCALYPLCFFYRRLKRQHPRSVLRFL